MLQVQAHVAELRTQWYSLVPYGQTPTDEQLDTWFDKGGVDREGVAGSRGDRQLKWYVGRLESSLTTGTDGFAVGSKLSLADVMLYNCFADCLTDEELGPAASDSAKLYRYPFTSLERTNGALANCPKIMASIAKVKEHAHTQKYLAKRGVQAF